MLLSVIAAIGGYFIFSRSSVKPDVAHSLSSEANLQSESNKNIGNTSSVSRRDVSIGGPLSEQTVLAKVPRSKIENNVTRPRRYVAEEAEVKTMESPLLPPQKPLPQFEKPMFPFVDGTAEAPFLTKPWPEFWLWIGLGTNFQYYRQTIPSIEGDAIFQNIQGPTAVFRAGFLGASLGLDISVNDTPGKMEGSSSLTVTNGSYHWQSLSAEGLYRLPSQWLLRFGIQHHVTPFMVLDATTANLDVRTNTLSMLTAGFDRSFILSEKLRAEWAMRYQQPVVSGSGDGSPFSVSPKFTFDGSIGGVYLLTKTQRLGVYWYGQWHEYSFDYGRGAGQFSGQQTLFYSSLDMRYGLEF
jgi:hypothetical protein